MSSRNSGNGNTPSKEDEPYALNNPCQIIEEVPALSLPWQVFCLILVF